MISINSVAFETLEKELADIKTVIKNKPRKGWIHLIRTSLGMTMAQLAHRLKMAPSNVYQLQQNEINDTITLKSLRKTADALNCDLYYVLLPKTSLKTTVENQAKNYVTQQMKRVNQTMDLESQHISKTVQTIQIKQWVDELIRKRERRIWDEF